MAKAQISYHQDKDLWTSFYPALQAHLPLTDITFTENHTRKQVKIPTLEVTPVKFNTDLFQIFIPGALHYNTTFLHLYLISDTEYKLQKDKLKIWKEILTQKKNQAWLILLFTDEIKEKNIFKSSVYDKLKLDLGFKSDKVFQIATNDLNLTDLIPKLKEIITTSVGSQVQQYEEDSRRIEQQRMIPGWNYCQYFILKESLSFTYEMMGLYTDALKYYDELDALFNQTMSEQGVPWFKRFGGNQKQDDRCNIFNLNTKEYREMIAENTISIFDFRMYLFSRQICLLVLIGDFEQVLIRGKEFIEIIEKVLKGYKSSLLKGFKEAWVYEMGKNFAKNVNDQRNLKLKCDLLLISRHQLKVLGLATGKLKESFMVISDLPTFIDDQDGVDILSDNEDINQKLFHGLGIRDIFESENSFLAEYEKITKELTQSLELAGRKHHAIMLKSELAEMFFNLESFEKAAALYQDVYLFYIDAGWELMGVLILEQFLKTQKQLDKAGNIDGLLRILPFENLLKIESAVGYFEFLEKEIDKLDEKLVVVDSKLIEIVSINLKDDLSKNAMVTADIKLKSLFPKEFRAKLILLLNTQDGLEMHLKLEDILKPGCNSFILQGKRSTIIGKYQPVKLLLSFQRLEFTKTIAHSVQKANELTIWASPESLELLANRHEDYHSESVLISIKTNAQKLTNPQLEIVPITDIVFSYEQVGVSVNDNKSVISLDKPQIKLEPCEANSTILLKLKYKVKSEGSFQHTIKLTLTDEKITYTKIVQLNLMIPIRIALDCISLPKSTVIKYNITNLTNYPLVLKSVNATPKLSCSFTKKYLLKDSVQLVSIIETNSDSVFELGYNSVSQEIYTFLLVKLLKILEKHDLGFVYGYLKDLVEKCHVDSVEFLLKGKVGVKFDCVIGSDLKQIGKERLEVLLKVLDEFWKDFGVISVKDLDDSLSTFNRIEYRNMVNHCGVLIYVSCKWIFEDKKSKIVIGDSVKCCLIISTEFWKSKSDQIKFSVQISSDRNNHFIRGKTKSFVELTNGEEVKVALELIALKEGRFLLPNIEFGLIEGDDVYFNSGSSYSGIVVTLLEQSMNYHFPEIKR